MHAPAAAAPWSSSMNWQVARTVPVQRQLCGAIGCSSLSARTAVAAAALLRWHSQPDGLFLRARRMLARVVRVQLGHRIIPGHLFGTACFRALFPREVTRSGTSSPRDAPRDADRAGVVRGNSVSPLRLSFSDCELG